MIQNFIAKHRTLLVDALLLLWVMFMSISEWINHASEIHNVLNVVCYVAVIFILVDDIQTARGKQGLPRICFIVGSFATFAVSAFYFISLIMQAVTAVK